jgi:hypothetical protein
MINNINKERRRSMNATPKRPSNKKQWHKTTKLTIMLTRFDSTAHEQAQSNKVCNIYNFGVLGFL